MRLRALTWASDKALPLEASKELGIALVAWSMSELDDDNVEDCIISLNEAEAILLHPASNQLFDQVAEGIDKNIPVISFGFNPAFWIYSNVSAKIVSAVNAYVVYGGLENIQNMLKY